MRYVSSNPYAGANWSTDTWAKANVHTHTTNSDGKMSPADVVNAYRDRGYKILSITDHDVAQHYWPTWPWPTDPTALGMLGVLGQEFSRSDHIIGWFADMWTAEDVADGTYDNNVTNVPGIIDLIGQRGGFAEIAHPGRYNRSLDYYMALFDAYHGHTHGIEVFNMGNRYPLDTQRWDDLLTMMRREGKSYALWGNSVDDSHEDYHIGRNYHVYVVPEVTTAALRESMTQGRYFSVYDPLGNRVDRHVGGAGGFWTAAPMVERVVVSQSTIELDVVRTTKVEWFTDGGSLAHTGEAVALNDNLGSYVRAKLTGANGSITLVQPFYLDAAPTRRGAAAGIFL